MDIGNIYMYEDIWSLMIIKLLKRWAIPRVLFKILNQHFVR